MSTENANPVELSDVTRHFGRFAALRAVTASFESSRLFAVLGDNGAGKSTLLRVIAGLIPPTRGKISLYGNAPSAVRERLAYMAHAPLLYDELDAMENLQYFACLYGIHDDRVCQDAMRTVSLDPDLPRRVGQYSQGMRQRLSLARALLHGPELLLLDEPFSNVDVASAQSMVGLLGELRDAGRTIFVVTHQPSLLTGVADEFIRMAAGRIVARTMTLDDAGPEDPATGEVAR